MSSSHNLKAASDNLKNMIDYYNWRKDEITYNKSICRDSFNGILTNLSTEEFSRFLTWRNDGAFMKGSFDGTIKTFKTFIKDIENDEDYLKKE